ncbi:MAG: ATP-binding protein, partial [Ktedonobacterales bacterium]
MPEERKLVSILFADVTGSTALGDSMDPEDVRALMSRYYEHARRIIPAYGGTLEKFIGDAVMAIFGLEQSHGDDAERALAAALGLREAVAADEILGVVFRLRIGVNTGEVVATGDRDSGDFLVTGDAVNVSARLQQGANPGEIIAGERTAHAAASAFSFEDERLLPAKGKPEPLRVYPLKGPRAKRQVERPAFVGRRPDLLQLDLLKERTLEERRPQLVSIVAPAGTGKSRLLEEFLAGLDPVLGFRVAFSRCLPYGQTLTFWPLRGLLTELLGGEPEKSHLQAVFRQAGYRTEDATRLADLILATLGIEETSAAADRESIFAAWRLLIEALSTEAPRIIVFEDLHWASESLLDLVEHIIHLRTSAALLLIALSRPELLDRRPTWGGGRQNFTFLALQPLGDRQTRELIDCQGYEIPPDIREHIVSRSGGNPFFALELLHTFAERSAGGRNAGVAALPDSVHAAVLARIDLLSPKERGILQAASVAGRSFGAAVLEAIVDGASGTEIAAALDSLLARDLIVQIEHDRYDFRHILIRDVAYGTLSRALRIRLHSKVAFWLEANAQSSGDHLDEYIELIAYHYREALQLSRQSAVPLSLPFVPADVTHVFARAGVLAGRTGSHAAAKNHLQLAVSLSPATEYVRLYEQLGDSVLWGNVRNQAYRDALASWRAGGGGDPETGARLIRKLLISITRDVLVPTTKQGDVEALHQEALALVAAAGDEDEQWRICITACFDPRFWNMSERLELKGAMSETREMAREAATYFEERRNFEALSEALDGYCRLSLYLSAPEDAIAAAERRFTILDLPSAEWAKAAGMTATLYYVLGRLDDCIEYVKAIFAQLKPGQPIAGLGPLVACLANAAFACGKWEEIDRILPKLDEIRELVMQYDPSALVEFIGGYLAALWVALAREDRPQIDALTAIIRRDGAALEPTLTFYLDCLVSDNVSPVLENWTTEQVVND